MADKPDFKFYSSNPPVFWEWLGKAVALVKKWSNSEGTSLQIEISSLKLGFFVTNDSFVGIFTRLYTIIADLELRVGSNLGEVFEPGALYDFFRALREQILSARRSILIVDPYMDADAFHKYCHEVPQSIAVHLLVKSKRDGKPSQYLPGLMGAVMDFNRSYGASIEIRQSGDLHDRILILDSEKVWVIGQSIKDAAKDSPTYFIPLDGGTASLKREYYERIWSEATTSSATSLNPINIG